MDNRVYLSVMTPAASTGTLTLGIQTFNASPNFTMTVPVTGITSGMSEKLIANTICTQVSSSLYQTGRLFVGQLGLITDPISGNMQVAFTDHCVSFFSCAQYSITQVSDTTGGNYYIDSCPVLCTVNEALSYGPLANQLLQTYAGGGLNTTQIIDLLAMSSAETTSILRNNIVASYYIFEFTTNLMNAIKFPNAPVKYFWNPYTLRPTIIAMATQVATFDLASRYEVDYQTGWCTFRFAQDLLFNYEPFDYNNQWRDAYFAGWDYIPREVKNAVLQWSYTLQTFNTIESLSDGVTTIKYEVDKNLRRREIFSPLKKYMQ